MERPARSQKRLTKVKATTVSKQQQLILVRERRIRERRIRIRERGLPNRGCEVAELEQGNNQ